MPGAKNHKIVIDESADNCEQITALIDLMYKPNKD